MYLRAVHAEFDITVLRKFIRDNPLGILVTAIESPNFPTLQCTHIPWILDVTDEQSKTELGTLRGHLARANPHSKSMTEAVQHTSTSNGNLEHEVSVIFTGPVHSYVTPKFYTETKPATGKVVPTWDYSAAQAYGKARIFWDSNNEETGSYLQKQISDLTKHSEETVMHHTGGENPSPWQVSDAPDNYIAFMKKNIIGIEINVDRLEGKFKMSQELATGDRQGTIKGLESLGTENGAKIASTIKEREAIKESKASVK
jgi:transcriptional regulator